MKTATRSDSVMLVGEHRSTLEAEKTSGEVVTPEVLLCQALFTQVKTVLVEKPVILEISA